MSTFTHHPSIEFLQAAKVMSGDVTNLARLDSECILTSDEQEVEHWAMQLNITPQQLRDAVQEVGNQLHDVRRHLRHAPAADDLPHVVQDSSD